MNGGSKPPLPRPGLVQKPGEDGRPKAPPPSPLRAKISSKPPGTGIPLLPPHSASTSESSGTRRLPAPLGGTVQPKKPTRDDITSMLKRTGSNTVATPLGSKPSFNGEAPLAEPPAQSKPPAAKVEPPAKAEAPAPAQREDKISEIPVDIEVDLGELDDGEPTAVQARLPPPNFGAIDAKAKLALELTFRLFPDKKGKAVELNGNRLFIGGKECGDVSTIKGSGETLRISFEKLGLKNVHLAMDDALISELGSLFNTIADSFLTRACETNEYAAILATSSGVRLSFFKSGSDSPNSSFPLRQSKEEESK